MNESMNRTHFRSRCLLSLMTFLLSGAVAAETKAQQPAKKPSACARYDLQRPSAEADKRDVDDALAGEEKTKHIPSSIAARCTEQTKEFFPEPNPNSKDETGSPKLNRALATLFTGPSQQSKRDEVTDAPQDPWEDQVIFGNLNGARNKLAKHGVTFNLRWTQFWQGMTHGDGKHTIDYSGKWDLWINAETEKMGLWEGGVIGTHLDFRYGTATYTHSNSALPSNTSVFFPIPNGPGFIVSSLFLSQRVNDRFSFIVGKINTIDLLGRNRINGGFGLDGFMNVVFAAPPSGFTPAAIFGGILSFRLQDRTSLTVMIFDPEDVMLRTGLERPFDTGIKVATTLGRQTRFWSKSGLHRLQAAYSTAERPSLGDILLPPGTEGRLIKNGSYFFLYSGEQMFYENKNDPSQAWGFYGQVNVSDGNPNFMHGAVIVALGGTSLIRSRPRDRFGVGYYQYFISRKLKDTVLPIVDLRNEHGFEAFYNFAITPWMGLTPDFQYSRPIRGDRRSEMTLGVRLGFRF
ncbi:MAG: carbohydrate porin [Pyrinomonadaceae bacterium]|nr:carbohydrate porin [Pyrinomonadaceae bacterium]